MALRDNRLDSIKGCLIFLVVFGHVIETATAQSPALARLYDFLYLFHMPAFIFLNGYVIKDRFSVDFQAVFYRIIIPFLALSLLYELVELLLNHSTSNYLRDGAPNWILWYLWSLIFWKLLTPLFMRLRLPLVFSVVIALAISQLDVDGYAFGVMRTFIFFPFFIAGALASGSHSFSLRRCFTTPAVLAGAAIMALGFACSGFFGTDMLYGSTPQPALNFGLHEGIAMRLGYYALATACVYGFCALAWRARFLAHLGTRTLFIYGLHGLLVKYLLWQPIQQLHVTWQTFAVALAVSAFLTWLLSRDWVKTLLNGWMNAVGQLLVPWERRGSRDEMRG
ncbi:acyltransferase family protein [Enterobacteriaceae bacterium 4M9]|nr:acyltransferase family protein [Enterobacteriaceae bacterium 4M9]